MGPIALDKATIAKSGAFLHCYDYL